MSTDTDKTTVLLGVTLDVASGNKDARHMGRKLKKGFADAFESGFSFKKASDFTLWQRRSFSIQCRQYFLVGHQCSSQRAMPINQIENLHFQQPQGY
jgi:hypothetical protein